MAGGGGKVSLGLVGIKTFGFLDLCQSSQSIQQSNSISDSARFYSESIFEQSLLCAVDPEDLMMSAKQDDKTSHPWSVYTNDPI